MGKSKKRGKVNRWGAEASGTSSVDEWRGIWWGDRKVRVREKAGEEAWHLALGRGSKSGRTRRHRQPSAKQSVQEALTAALAARE